MILQHLQTNRPILFAPGLKGFQSHVLYALALYSIDQRFEYNGSSFASIRAYLLQFITTIDFSSEDFKNPTPILYDKLASAIMTFYLKMKIEPAKICPDLIGSDFLSYESAFVRWMRTCVGASASFLTADFMWDIGSGQFIAVLLSKVRPDLVRLTRVVFGNDLTDTDVLNNWRECEVALTVFGIPKPSPQQLADQLCMLCFAADIYTVMSTFLPVSDPRGTFAPERKFETGLGVHRAAPQAYAGPTNRMQRIDILLEKIDQLTRPLNMASRPAQQPVIHPTPPPAQMYQPPPQIQGYQQPPTQMYQPPPPVPGYQQPPPQIYQPPLQMQEQVMPQVAGQFQEKMRNRSPRKAEEEPTKRGSDFETELKIIKGQRKSGKEDSDDSIDEADEIPQRILKSRVLPQQQKPRKPLTRTEEERIFDKVHRLMTGQEAGNDDDSLPQTRIKRTQNTDPHLLAKQRLLERAKKKREELQLAKAAQEKKSQKDELIRKPHKESTDTSSSSSPRKSPRKRVVIDVDNDTLPDAPTRTRIIDDGNSYLKIHLQRKMLEGKAKQVKVSISPSVGFDAKPEEEDVNESASELIDDNDLSDTAQRVKETRERYKDLIPDFTESDFLLPPKNVLIPKPKVSPVKETRAKASPHKPTTAVPKKSNIPRPSPKRKVEPPAQPASRIGKKKPMNEESGYGYPSELDYSYSASASYLQESQEIVKPKKQPRSDAKKTEEKKVPDNLAKPLFEKKTGSPQRGKEEPETKNPPKREYVDLGTSPDSSVALARKAKETQKELPTQPKKAVYADAGTSPNASKIEEQNEPDRLHLADTRSKISALDSFLENEKNVDRSAEDTRSGSSKQRKSEQSPSPGRSPAKYQRPKFTGTQRLNQMKERHDQMAKVDEAAEKISLLSDSDSDFGEDPMVKLTRKVDTDSLVSVPVEMLKQETTSKRRRRPRPEVKEIGIQKSDSLSRYSDSYGSYYSYSRRRSGYSYSPNRYSVRYSSEYSGRQYSYSSDEEEKDKPRVTEEGKETSSLEDGKPIEMSTIRANGKPELSNIEETLSLSTTNAGETKRSECEGTTGKKSFVSLPSEPGTDEFVTIEKEIMATEEPSDKRGHSSTTSPAKTVEENDLSSESDVLVSDVSTNDKSSDIEVSAREEEEKMETVHGDNGKVDLSVSTEGDKHQNSDKPKQSTSESFSFESAIESDEKVKSGTVQQKSGESKKSELGASLRDRTSTSALTQSKLSDSAVQEVDSYVKSQVSTKGSTQFSGVSAKSGSGIARSEKTGSSLMESRQQKTQDVSEVPGVELSLGCTGDGEASETRKSATNISGIETVESNSADIFGKETDEKGKESVMGSSNAASSGIHTNKKTMQSEDVLSDVIDIASDVDTRKETLKSEKDQRSLDPVSDLSSKIHTSKEKLQSEDGLSEVIDVESNVHAAKETLKSEKDQRSLSGVSDVSSKIHTSKDTMQSEENEKSLSGVHTGKETFKSEKDERRRLSGVSDLSSKIHTSKEKRQSEDSLSDVIDLASDVDTRKETLNSEKDEMSLGAVSDLSSKLHTSKEKLRIEENEKSLSDISAVTSDVQSNKERLKSETDQRSLSGVSDVSSTIHTSKDKMQSEENEKSLSDEDSDVQTTKEQIQNEKDQMSLGTVSNVSSKLHTSKDKTQSEDSLSDVIDVESDVHTSKETLKNERSQEGLVASPTDVDSDSHTSKETPQGEEEQRSLTQTPESKSNTQTSTEKIQSEKPHESLPGVTDPHSNLEGEKSDSDTDKASQKEQSISSDSIEIGSNIEAIDDNQSEKSQQSVLSDVIEIHSQASDDKQKSDVIESLEIHSCDESVSEMANKSQTPPPNESAETKQEQDNSEDSLSGIWSGSDKGNDNSPKTDNKALSMNVSLISTTGTCEQSPRSEIDSSRQSQGLTRQTGSTHSKRTNHSPSSDAFSSPTEDTLDLGLSDAVETERESTKTTTPKTQEEAKDERNCFSTESTQSLSQHEEIITKTDSFSLSASEEHALPFETIESSNKEESTENLHSQSSHKIPEKETSVTLSVELPTLTLPKEDILQLSAPLEDEKVGSSPIESTVEIESAIVDLHGQTISISDDSDDSEEEERVSIKKESSEKVRRNDSFSLFNDDDVDSDGVDESDERKNSDELLKKKELSSSEQEDLFNSVVTLPTDSLGSKKSGGSENSAYALPSNAVSSNSCILGSNSERSNLPSAITVGDESVVASSSSKLLQTPPRSTDAVTSSFSQSVDESSSHYVGRTPVLAKTPPLRDSMVVLPAEKETRRVSFLPEFDSPTGYRLSQIVRASSEKMEQDHLLTQEYLAVASKSTTFVKLSPQEERILCCVLPVAREASQAEITSAVSKMLGVSTSDVSVGRIIQNITAFFSPSNHDSESEAHEESSDSDMYF